MIWKCTFLKQKENLKWYYYQEKGECSRLMMIITYAEPAVWVHIYKGLAFYYLSIHIPISTYHLYCLVFQSHPHLYSDESRPLHRGGGGGGGAVIHTYMFYLSAHPDPEIRWGGGGDLKKKIFWPFRHQFGGSPSVPKFFCAVGKICSQVKQGFPF